MLKKKTTKKKYIPNSKEKYMCAKHKKFFSEELVKWKKEIIICSFIVLTIDGVGVALHRQYSKQCEMTCISSGLNSSTVLLDEKYYSLYFGSLIFNIYNNLIMLST